MPPRIVMSRVVLACAAVCAALAVAPSRSCAQNTPNTTFAVGTNTEGIEDWSSEEPFADAFKSSRPWISVDAHGMQNQNPIATDAHGWVTSLAPGQGAETLMFWDVSPRYPSGSYDVTYDGSGTIIYSGTATLVSHSPGHDVISVPVMTRERMGGIGLTITSTDPSNYIRNIKVMIPGTHAGDLFNPAFLDKMKEYKVVRFQGWMLGQGGAGIALVNWSDSASMDDARWRGKGAPIEVICDLSNRLGADPWLCVSHLATDDFVRQLASTTMTLLDPTRKVYVEHSNEVWNGVYAQARYAEQQATALGLSEPGLNNPGAFQLRALYQAYRSTQIFKIFEGVFPPQRLVRVLGSFINITGPHGVSATELKYQDTLQHTDALAIAPYWGPRTNTAADEARIAAMSLDTLMDDELPHHSLPEAMSAVAQQIGIANQYNVQLIAYEGGQSLVGVGPAQQDAAINALFDAANRDPRMGALYQTFLEQWGAAGGNLLVHYNNCGRYGVYGRWGLLEYIDEPRAQATKFDTVMTWIEAHGGGPVPGIGGSTGGSTGNSTGGLSGGGSGNSTGGSTGTSSGSGPKPVSCAAAPAGEGEPASLLPLGALLYLLVLARSRRSH